MRCLKCLKSVRATNKESICEKLESFISTTDWSHINWKEVVSFEKDIFKKWKQSGDVGRGAVKKINKRFNESMSIMHEHFSKERDYNFNFRKKLVEQVKSLADLDDVLDAISKCKDLQGKWQVTVSSAKKQENELWGMFRNACDAVFERRKSEKKNADKELQSNYQKKEQLCKVLEEIKLDSVDDLGQANKVKLNTQEDWALVGELRKSHVLKIEKRFKRALSTLDQRVTEIESLSFQAEFDYLHKQASVCSALEMLDKTNENYENNLNSLKKQWDDIPVVKDKVLAKNIQNRFDKALKSLQGDLNKQDHNQMVKNLATRLELCLHMEILAEIESSAEYREARMNLQIARLSGALENKATDSNDEAVSVQRDWCLSGAVENQYVNDLEQRFSHAVGCFNNK